LLQEEEIRARKREQLMQQSRREAQLSRLRFEEQRLKVGQCEENEFKFCFNLTIINLNVWVIF